MRVGCCSYSYRDVLTKGGKTLEWFVEECYNMGLDGIELTSYYFPQTDDEYIYSLKRCAASYGLDIYATATRSNFCQADGGARADDVAHVKEWVDISMKLGSPCMRVFAGGAPDGHTQEEAMSWAVECLKECADWGESKGVVIALENHGGITSTADQVLEIVKRVDHDWFGINLDAGNYSKDPYAEIERTGPHAVTTHAKVTTNSPTGRHEVDYRKVRDILDKVGYKGYLSIEYEEKEDPLAGIPRFVETLKAAVS